MIPAALLAVPLLGPIEKHRRWLWVLRANPVPLVVPSNSIRISRAIVGLAPPVLHLLFIQHRLGRLSRLPGGGGGGGGGRGGVRWEALYQHWHVDYRSRCRFGFRFLEFGFWISGFGFWSGARFGGGLDWGFRFLGLHLRSVLSRFGGEKEREERRRKERVWILYGKSCVFKCRGNCKMGPTQFSWRYLTCQTKLYTLLSHG